MSFKNRTPMALPDQPFENTFGSLDSSKPVEMPEDDEGDLGRFPEGDSRLVIPGLVARNIELEAEVEALRLEIKELQQEVREASRGAYEEGREAMSEEQRMNDGW